MQHSSIALGRVLDSFVTIRKTVFIHFDSFKVGERENERSIGAIKNVHFIASKRSFPDSFRRCSMILKTVFIHSIRFVYLFFILFNRTHKLGTDRSPIKIHKQVKMKPIWRAKIRKKTVIVCM